MPKRKMNITVNGIIKEVKVENLSVTFLLKEENVLSLDGIAIAVNQQVIPKSEWEQTFIKQNDKILIIKATQGG